MLNEFDSWLNLNQNDVIIIHFNHDVKGTPEEREIIATNLEAIVKSMWDTGSGVELMKSVNGNYQKLSELIQANTRVWIWLSQEIEAFITDKSWFQLAQKDIFYRDTWASVNSLDCGKVVDQSRN